MQSPSSARTQAKAQMSVKQKSKILNQDPGMDHSKGKKYSSHPDLELAKSAAKVQSSKVEHREELLQDAPSFLPKLDNSVTLKGKILSYGKTAVKWAQKNKAITIPLSLVAGAVATVIVKTVMGRKDSEL